MAKEKKVVEETAVKTTEEKAVVQKPEPIPGLEGIESDMIMIPRLKLVQKMSEEVDEYEYKPGSLINSVDKEVIMEFSKSSENTITVIPVKVFRNRIKFIPVDDGGGMTCQAQDGKNGVGDPGGKCMMCPHSQWQKDEKENLPPACTEFLNVFVLVRGYDFIFPLVLSFGKTSYKTGKKFINLFLMASQRTQKSPWHLAYKLGVKPETSDAGTYHVFTIAPGGKSDDEEILTAENAYKFLMETEVQVHTDIDMAKDESSVEEPDHMKKVDDEKSPF